MDHAGQSGLYGPPPRIACQRDRASGSTVVGAIARDDLMPSGKEAGQLDGVFSGFRAAIGKEECIDIAGRDFGKLLSEPRTHFGCHERIRVR